jgi:Polyglycine hydrolase-like, structural repeat
MSMHMVGVWRPGTGAQWWATGLSADQFEQKNQQYLPQGLRLTAADVSDGRYAGVWRPGSGSQWWYSGPISTAAQKDQQYFNQGLRLAALSLHEGGVFCLWRPGTGAQWWATSLSVDEFKAKDAAHFGEGLRIAAIDELNGRFAAVWRPGTGAQWWAWGSVADIVAKDKMYFAQGLRISAIGGHQRRVVAVWRPGAGVQWWKSGIRSDAFKDEDAGYFAQGLRLNALRVLSDPSAKDPQMSGWSLVADQEIDNEEWTEECQGLTTDGSSWLIASNNEDFRGVHRLSISFNDHLGKVGLPPGAGDHVGDLDFDPATARLYVPVEPKPSVWVLSNQLQTITVAPLGGGASPPQGGSMPWCAINPWNGWLYSSTFDGVDRVYAYDPANQFTHVSTLVLGGGALNAVQGGCFSPAGHLYLTSGGSGRVHAFDSIDGTPLGSVAVPYSPGGVDGEEMEGIALGHLIHGNGSHSWVHVVILDNDITNRDDVFLKHYCLPNPANL